MTTTSSSATASGSSWPSAHGLASSARTAASDATVLGADLVGARYEPPYPNVEGAHRVVAGDFVSHGRRHRHRAPGSCVRARGPRGRAGAGMARLQAGRRRRALHRPGARVRPRAVRQGRRPADRRGPPGARGAACARRRYEHSYPFCWRCETPLLYYARTSWYVRTTAVKDRLLAVNERRRLVPRTHQARPVRQLAGEQRGLGALARALLGHPAADLAVRRRTRHAPSAR